MILRFNDPVSKDINSSQLFTFWETCIKRIYTYMGKIIVAIAVLLEDVYGPTCI